MHCSFSFPNKFILILFFDTAFGAVVLNKGCRRQDSLCAVKPAHESSAEFMEMWDPVRSHCSEIAACWHSCIIFSLHRSMEGLESGLLAKAVGEISYQYMAYQNLKHRMLKRSPWQTSGLYFMNMLSISFLMPHSKDKDFNETGKWQEAAFF